MGYSMVSCPNCGKQIYDDETICPYCWGIINEVDKDKIKDATCSFDWSKKLESEFKRNTNALLAVSIFLLLLGTVFLILYYCVFSPDGIVLFFSILPFPCSLFFLFLLFITPKKKCLKMKEIDGHYYLAYRTLFFLELYMDGGKMTVEHLRLSIARSWFISIMKVKAKIGRDRYLVVTSTNREEIKFAIAENKKG